MGDRLIRFSQITPRQPEEKFRLGEVGVLTQGELTFFDGFPRTAGVKQGFAIIQLRWHIVWKYLRNLGGAFQSGDNAAAELSSTQGGDWNDQHCPTQTMS